MDIEPTSPEGLEAPSISAPFPFHVKKGFEKVLKTCTRMQTFEIKGGPKMGRFLGSILDQFEGSSSNCTFSETSRNIVFDGKGQAITLVSAGEGSFTNGKKH